MLQLITARYVMPVSAPIIENGAVLINSRSIMAVGRRESLAIAYPEAMAVDF